MTNFRSFSRLDMDVPRRILLLQGNNAQGKTSLLEAIYFFSTFTSIQASSERQLINFQNLDEKISVARLIANFYRGEVSHKLEIRIIVEKNEENGSGKLRKEILLDDVKRTTHQSIGYFNAVIFLPQMTKIIEGGPDERRRYLNFSITQVVPGYGKALSEYSQIVTQRNALLKQISERNSDTNQLDYWDELLAERAVFIIKERFKATREMELIAIKNHRKLTDDNEIIQLIYRPAIDPVNFNSREELPSKELNATFDLMTIKEFKLEFLRQLILRRKEEISRGITTIGPHRDEMRFLSNQLDLGDFGSRGQVRTALLSLKLAEVDWMHQRTTFRPILLLDETMAELDQIRRSKLLESIIEGHQAILTTTDLKLFDRDFVKKASLWHIRQGIVEDSSQKGD
ncbi:MAG: DNA replication and repair protein RecF [Anaerolineaceae bacterium]|nr:DNA replication and repair protein RecF [Anaerolineaceae bacterium]